MNSTQKNLLLVACVSTVVVPVVFLFYHWSARVDGGTKPEVACSHNLLTIDGAEQEWAMENHKTTNDTPTRADLQSYLRSASFTCPAGGTYSLAKIGDPPTCSIPSHAALYQKQRPEPWLPGK